MGHAVSSRTRRGRLLISSWTVFKRGGGRVVRPVPVGKYWRSVPLAFLLLPRCVTIAEPWLMPTVRSPSSARPGCGHRIKRPLMNRQHPLGKPGSARVYVIDAPGDHGRSAGAHGCNSPGVCSGERRGRDRPIACGGRLAARQDAPDRAGPARRWLSGHPESPAQQCPSSQCLNACAATAT